MGIEPVFSARGCYQRAKISYYFRKLDSTSKSKHLMAVELYATFFAATCWDHEIVKNYSKVTQFLLFSSSGIKVIAMIHRNCWYEKCTCTCSSLHDCDDLDWFNVIVFSTTLDAVTSSISARFNFHQFAVISDFAALKLKYQGTDLICECCQMLRWELNDYNLY